MSTYLHFINLQIGFKPKQVLKNPKKSLHIYLNKIISLTLTNINLQITPNALPGNIKIK